MSENEVKSEMNGSWPKFVVEDEWNVNSNHPATIIFVEKADEGLYVNCDCGDSMGPLTPEMARHYAEAHRQIHVEDLSRLAKYDLLTAMTRQIDQELIYGKAATTSKPRTWDFTIATSSSSKFTFPNSPA